ncbi:putative RNA-directed DNA polymerase [Helianthus annuus]|nr:putative RNA-directed DNA polymerase [Helianthus annuus]
MADLQVAGGIKKLNQSNYKKWSTCIKSYLQGQDLWQVTNGIETRQPTNDVNGAVGKWQVKAGRAMFVIKTTVEEEIPDHIQDLEYPKQTWDMLQSLFTKKNEVRLQLIEGELMSVSQGDLFIAQYFRKVKNQCREIGDLDPQSKVSEARMKQTLVHGLKPEYRSFVAAIQGWANQPNITEFENLLAGQEAYAAQQGGVSIKTEDEKAFLVEKKRNKGQTSKPWHYRSKSQDRSKQNEGDRKGKQSGEAESEKKGKNGKNRRFPFKCYNCGVRGHMAKDCTQPKAEGNATTTEHEEPWDVEAYMAQVEEVLALTATTELKSNKLEEWIVDSGCSNHLTGKKEKLSKCKKIYRKSGCGYC